MEAIQQTKQDFTDPNRKENIRFTLLALYPAVVPIIFLTAWSLAVQHLGFEPKPFQHDPKFYGGSTVNLLAAFRGPLFLLFPFVIFFTLKMSLNLWKQSKFLKLFVLFTLWLMFTIAVFSQPTALAWYID